MNTGGIVSNNGNNSLEGKAGAAKPVENQNPRIRVLYLRGPNTDNPDNLDPLKALKNYAKVSVPATGLDALLELAYVRPHLVLADTDYRVTFASENSLVDALADATRSEQKLREYTGVDFLQLACKNKIPAVLSPNESPLPLPPSRKQQKRKKSPTTTPPVEQNLVLRDTLRAMGIQYVPRSKANNRTRREFESFLRTTFDRISTQLKNPDPAETDVLDAPYNFYVLLGSTSSGKTRTIEALIESGAGRFWQIPKATSRPQRKTDKVATDTFFVKPHFFDERKGEFVEYSLYQERYGLPKNLIATRLHDTNILFGTASVNVVTGLTDAFNGKIVPILLYPPRAFVEARVAATPEKEDRVAEVINQYHSFDELTSTDGVRYFIRFSPENMHKSPNGGARLPGENIYDEKTQTSVDEVIMTRVRSIILVEDELRKRAAEKKIDISTNQAFYNMWADRFVEHIFPRLTGFEDLERRVNNGESVKLFEVDNPADVERYTKWISDMGCDISRGKIKEILPREVVAAGRSYGIGYIFLNPPGTLKYLFGTEGDLVRSLLMRALKPMFPYTVRADDKAHNYEAHSNFAYVRSRDGPKIDDLFQYRITDQDDINTRDVPPQKWPLRGIAIGFSATKNLEPVDPAEHYYMRQENYDSMVYRETKLENGSTPQRNLLPPHGLLSTSIDQPEPKIQEPPALQ